MSPAGRPDPPDGAALARRLQVETWPAERVIVRIFDSARGPLAFNPTAGSARFRPIHADGEVVPTAYGGEDAETAVAETLLRGARPLAKGIPLRLYLPEVEGKAIGSVRPTRDLRLARLRGRGLTRLGLRREQVSACPAADYPYTAAWAQAIHDCGLDLDGILWTSRQSDAGAAVVLWSDRVVEGDLADGAGHLSLDLEPGLEYVRLLCDAAGYDFEG